MELISEYRGNRRYPSLYILGPDKGTCRLAMAKNVKKRCTHMMTHKRSTKTKRRSQMLGTDFTLKSILDRFPTGTQIAKVRNAIKSRYRNMRTPFQETITSPMGHEVVCTGPCYVRCDWAEEVLGSSAVAA